MPNDYPKKIPIINNLLYTKIMIHLKYNYFHIHFHIMNKLRPYHMHYGLNIG